MRVRFNIDGPVARANPQILEFARKDGLKYIAWCDLWVK